MTLAVSCWDALPLRGRSNAAVLPMDALRVPGEGASPGMFGHRSGPIWRMLG